MIRCAVQQLKPKVAQKRVLNNLQPDTKSNPNPNTSPNPNPNPTPKQHAVVNIQLNIVACPTRIQINSYKTCCCTVCSMLGGNCHTAVTNAYHTPNHK